MRFQDVTFLRVKHVHAAHDAALRYGGGSGGVRDLGMIESATMAPQGGYYTSLAEMAAVYVHGIARNHGYVDGNKRTAVNVLLMFFGANGFPTSLDDEWPGIIEGVADGSITRDALTAHIVTRLMGGVDVVIEPD